MRMWDNVNVRWERGDRTSQKDQWRSEVQKARGNETVIFYGSGSVRQLESGYDWTRTQTNPKKRLDNVDKMWDNVVVEWVRGRKPKVGQSLDPSSAQGGKRIENLWKPTCENLRFLSQSWPSQSCWQTGKRNLGSVTLVGFDSLPEILSWPLSEVGRRSRVLGERG